MSFLATPRTSLPLVFTRGAVIAAIAIPTFLLFAAPGLIPLIATLKGQFAAASGDLRPGDQGQLSELISRLGLLVV
jgi:cell wall assembly regulator SMI1